MIVMFMLFANTLAIYAQTGIEHEEATASDKKKKPCHRYKHEYTELWYCLKPLTKGDTYVQAGFSCAHGGRFD